MANHQAITSAQLTADSAVSLRWLADCPSFVVPEKGNSFLFLGNSSCLYCLWFVQDISLFISPVGFHMPMAGKLRRSQLPTMLSLVASKGPNPFCFS